MQEKPLKYNLVAIILHWVMAIAFFLMLLSGLVMTFAPIQKLLKFQMYQWHKSLGVLLLIAFFLRLAVRLLTIKPDLPHKMNKLEKLAAKAGHFMLYAWMLILPLSGWIMVSSSPFGLPTMIFGWVEWPHVPGIAGNLEIENLAKEAHEFLAYSFMALIAVHIGAVIKHWVIDKENILPRIGIGRIKKG